MVNGSAKTVLAIYLSCARIPSTVTSVWVRIPLALCGISPRRREFISRMWDNWASASHIRMNHRTIWCAPLSTIIKTRWWVGKALRGFSALQIITTKNLGCVGERSRPVFSLVTTSEINIDNQMTLFWCTKTIMIQKSSVFFCTVAEFTYHSPRYAMDLCGCVGAFPPKI